MTEILAIIPARSGSKTIPHKNISLIGGKPLIVHSIEHALKSKHINNVHLNTDSEEYANIGLKHGAAVPFIRPSELAQDHSTDLEVFKNHLEWIKANNLPVPDLIVQLRPTYPIRNVRDIDKMIEIAISDQAIDSVRSLSPSPETPYKMWLMEEDGSISPVAKCELDEAYNEPRQNLPKVYLQNACIDIIRSKTILEDNSMCGKNIKGYIMPHIFDIDTPDQFEKAHKRIVFSGNTYDGDTKLRRRFVFDIDGVIASLTPQNDYTLATPLNQNISIINRLKQRGHEVILFTARGYTTKIDWRELTTRQMNDWGVNYDELHFGKPNADYYIDDKLITMSDLSIFLETTTH